MTNDRRYTSFGKHIGFHLVRKFATDYGRDWQLELAKFTTTAFKQYQRNPHISSIVLDRYEFRKNLAVYMALRREAEEFIKQHPTKGSPLPDKTYYYALYGTSKKTTLKQDERYQKILFLSKGIRDPEAKEKFREALRERKKHLSTYKAEYEFVKYKARASSGEEYYKYSEELQRMHTPSNVAIREALFADAFRHFIMKSTKMATDLEAKFHGGRTGEELEFYLGQLRDELPYKELLEWICDTIESGSMFPIHSTNKHSLRESEKFKATYFNNQSVRNVVKRKIENEGLNCTVDEYLMFWYAREFGDPENTSRSGVKYYKNQQNFRDPKVRTSLNKNIRMYGHKGTTFPGLKGEQQQALWEFEKFSPEVVRLISRGMEIKKDIQLLYKNVFKNKPIDQAIREAIVRKIKRNEQKRVEKEFKEFDIEEDDEE